MDVDDNGGGLSFQANEDFNRARNQAVFSRIQHFMNVDKDNLLSFSDVKDILKPKNQSYQGMQVVPLTHIVGSEGRYHDFNKHFLPRVEHLRNRWRKVDQARLQDVVLPPIQLYEIGGVYFVRDGNHRVSVARSQGGEVIDAEVISLSSEIPIDPSMTADDLRKSLIAYEKDLFYEKTRFAERTGDNELDFSEPGRYDVIYNHILVHKQYLDEKHGEEHAFDDALTSWYADVYAPILKIIKDEWIELNFPGHTPSDLYVWIVKHWDFLKRKYGGDYAASEAAKDFTVKYGRARVGVLRRATAWFGRVFKRPPTKPH
jgi:hypothetical protein